MIWNEPLDDSCRPTSGLGTESARVRRRAAKAISLAFIGFLVSCVHRAATGPIDARDLTERWCEHQSDCLVANVRSCNDCTVEPFPINQSANDAHIAWCSMEDYNYVDCRPPPAGKPEDFRAECENHLCVLYPLSH
jgi:hypothetical protein